MDDITAPFGTSDLVELPPLRCVPILTVAWKTDMGRVRENNEDKCEYWLANEPSEQAARGSVFVVCDGMGGHEAGQIASEVACKTFLQTYLHHPATEITAALTGAANAANRFVFDQSMAIPSRRGMGTTLTALAVVQDRAYIAHVGDSRLYRLRGEDLTMLTQDMTWVEQVVSQGLMTRAEAEAHPYRHMILQAVGTAADITPAISQDELQAGDIYLLCSDGLNNHVEDSEIHAVLSSLGPSAACWELVARAMNGGGSDNCTVMVVRVDGLDPAGEA